MFRLLSQMNPSDVEVFSLGGEGHYAPLLKERGIRVTCLNLTGVWGVIKAIPKLARSIRAAKANVAQTWMYRADLIGGLAARLAGVPVCWGLRAANLDWSLNRPSTVLLARICGALSRWIPSAIISCSAAAVKIHRTAGYVGPITVIPNGYELGRYEPDSVRRGLIRAEVGVAGGAVVFGHVGRRDPLKDHRTLLTAFSMLAGSHPTVRLMLVGAGLEEGSAYLQSLTDGLDLDGRLIALGQRNDVADLMNAMDIFVLSSAGEAFPNVVAEAMACRVPCVVTDVGDAAAIVGDTGWIIPPRDPSALFAAMSSALDAYPSLAERGMRAHARIREHYRLDHVAARYQAVWSDVVRKRSASRSGSSRAR